MTFDTHDAFGLKHVVLGKDRAIRHANNSRIRNRLRYRTRRCMAVLICFQPTRLSIVTICDARNWRFDAARFPVSQGAIRCFCSWLSCLAADRARPCVPFWHCVPAHISVLRVCVVRNVQNRVSRIRAINGRRIVSCKRRGSVVMGNGEK